MLADEHSERIRHLTYGRYFARFIFVSVLLIVGVQGADEPRFRVAASVAAATFGFFWTLDDIRQRNRLRRLTQVIAEFEEKTAPQYWQDNFIRYEYGLMYSFQERYFEILQALEPASWVFGTLLVLWTKGFVY
jgi:hypothetical protein